MKKEREKWGLFWGLEIPWIGILDAWSFIMLDLVWFFFKIMKWP